MSEVSPSAHEGHDSDVETLRSSSSDLGSERSSRIGRARRTGGRTLGLVGASLPDWPDHIAWNYDADGGADEVT